MKKRLFIALILMGSTPAMVHSKEKPSIYKTESRFIHDICFTPGKEAIAVTDNHSIKVFNAASQELLAELKDGHRERILKIDISSDSTLLVSGGADSSIVIWDFIQQRKIKTLTYHQSMVTSLDLSPGGRYLVSGGEGMVCLYDMQEDKLIQEITDQLCLVTDVLFSPDEKVFACAGADHHIYLYETQSGKLITTLKGHRNWVRDLVFSADGKRLFSCGDDSKIIAWDTSDWYHVILLQKYFHRYNWPLSADIYKDNKTYAYGDFKGNIGIGGHHIGYTANVKVPVSKVLISSKKGNLLSITAATRGKGVVLLHAKDMKTKITW